jgi:hypothetical protein
LYVCQTGLEPPPPTNNQPSGGQVQQASIVAAGLLPTRLSTATLWSTVVDPCFVSYDILLAVISSPVTIASTAVPRYGHCWWCGAYKMLDPDMSCSSTDISKVVPPAGNSGRCVLLYRIRIFTTTCTHLWSPISSWRKLIHLLPRAAENSDVAFTVVRTALGFYQYTVYMVYSRPCANIYEVHSDVYKSPRFVVYAIEKLTPSIVRLARD